MNERLNERRRNFRHRTLLNGRLETDKLAGWSLDCAVRNVSEGGARLTLPSDALVPERVRLAIANQPRRSAQLIWYRDGEAGFSLVDESAKADWQSAKLAARIAAITGGAVAEPRFTHP